MIEFYVSVQGQKITCEKVRGELVSGLRGGKVRFSWSGEWKQLRRNAVFRAGSLSRNVMDLEKECEIPWEVLVEPGPVLLIGIVGTDEEGNEVTPTLEAEMGEIQRGANLAEDPTPWPNWKWLQKVVETAIEKIRQLLRGGQEQIDQTISEGKAKIDAITDRLQGLIDNGNVVIRPGEDGQARHAIENHINDKDNPHEVSPEQIGAMPVTGGAFSGVVKLQGMILSKDVDYGIEPPGWMEEGQVFLVEDPVDVRVVECGRANAWEYLKLSDGTAVCWKAINSQVSATAWRNKGSYCWTSGMSIEFPYPFPFASLPAEFIHVTNGTGWDPITYAAKSSQRVDMSSSIRLVATQMPKEALEVTISLLAVGRWK